MMRRAALLATMLSIGLVTACASARTEDDRPFTRFPPASLEPDSLPLGGPHTISISVMYCTQNCPIVNVMLDPDNYWQRTSEDGAYSGTGPDGLYSAVSNAFLAQGFDDASGILHVTKDNTIACPQYLERGRIYKIRLGRGAGIGQLINYDSACYGSLDAVRAKNATDALAGLTDLTHIFDGTVTVEDAMGDEE